ncbi:MAG: hypothetical protein HRT45_00385, partial [Bdellovibrionales bacterium]|nr:hypothetical protein [Bdellovibrionales bacterium]
MKELLKGYLKSISKFAALTAFFVVLFPSTFLEVDVRSAPAVTMRIQIDDSSPAMVAVREVQYQKPITRGEEFDVEMNLETTNMGVVTLNSGQGMQDLFDQPNQLELPSGPSDLNPYDSAPRLNGIRISAGEVEEVDLPVELESGSRLQPVLLASASMRNPLVAKIATPSSNFLATANFDKNPNSFESKAERLVNEALEEQSKDQRVTIATSSGQQIVVMAPKQPSEATTIASQPNVADNKISRVAASDSSLSEPADSWGSVLEEKTLDTPYLISGRLKTVQEVSADSKISLLHIVDGRVMSEGTVWSRDFRYEISVEGSAGYLLAQITEPAGDVLQEGKVRLDTLEIQSLKQTQIASLSIALETPDRDEIRVVVESGYSFANNKIGVPGAQVFLQPFGIELEKEGNREFIEKEVLIGARAVVE